MGKIPRKGDTTLQSFVQQNPLDQRYFIIQYPQQTRTSFVNSTQKSSTVFCLCLQRGDRWTKVPLVAGTEELKVEKIFTVRSVIPPTRVDFLRILVEVVSGYLLGEDDGSDLSEEPKDARCGSKT